MVDVKQAIRAARDYITEVYAPETPRGLQLEEVELTDDEGYWLVTFGFDTDREAEPIDPVRERVLSVQGIKTPPRYVRDYKVIKIRADDGKPLSMKMKNGYERLRS